MILTHSLKSQIICNKVDNEGRYGGQKWPDGLFRRNFGRRGNHSYQIAVTLPQFKN